MFCGKCGTKIKEGDSFCTNCGQQVIGVSSQEEKLNRIKKGDNIKFGNYCQRKSQSEIKEPIEWEVLDVNDVSAFLISKYILHAKEYNKIDQDTRWRDSDLRKWLNEVFYEEAFNDEERSRIIMTNIVDEYYSDIIKTEDKIILLSEQEVNNFYPSIDEKLCKATEYAKSNGLRYSFYLSYSDKKAEYPDCVDYYPWWLRNAGKRSQRNALHVNDTNFEVVIDESAIGHNFGVRPAMWVKI